MRVRKADPSDAQALARVHVGTWRATYRGIVPDAYLDALDYGRSEARWRENLERAALRESASEGVSPGSATIAAEDEEQGVVGFAAFGPNRDKDPNYDSELYAIYVLPASQKKGAGTMLVREASRILADSGFRSMIVWVLSANPARSFYEKLGGEEVGQRMIEIGGAQLAETAYGWKDLRKLAGTIKIPT